MHFKLTMCLAMLLLSLSALKFIVLGPVLYWYATLCLQNKLKVYLSPFLYGMRYTSYGRHFTKLNKLKEVNSSFISFKVRYFRLSYFHFSHKFSATKTSLFGVQYWNLRLAHKDMVVLVVILVHEKEDHVLRFSTSHEWLNVAIKAIFSELELWSILFIYLFLRPPIL